MPVAGNRETDDEAFWHQAREIVSEDCSGAKGRKLLLRKPCDTHWLEMKRFGTIRGKSLVKNCFSAKHGKSLAMKRSRIKLGRALKRKHSGAKREKSLVVKRSGTKRGKCM